MTLSKNSDLAIARGPATHHRAHRIHTLSAGNQTMKRISNLALLALLPATAVAQRPDPKMEWEEFLTENGRGSWSVMWNPATGTPDAIYGKGLATGDVNAPTSSSATGTLTYVHALEQTSPSKLTASNAGVVLWGK